MRLGSTPFSRWLNVWQSDLLMGLIATFVAVGGSTMGHHPRWITAVLGIFAGSYFTLAAIQVAVVNAQYVNQVIPDETGEN